MTQPPPGWYSDSDDLDKVRWWDGTAWAPNAPKGSTPSHGRRWLIGIAVASALAGLALGGFGGALAMLGMLGTCVGIAAIYREGLKIVPLTSRRAGLGVVALSMGIAIVGGAIAPRPEPSAQLAGAPAISSTPAASAEVIDVTKRRETVTEAIPYSRTEVEDPDRDVGESAVITEGVDGARTVVWLITVVDGVDTKRVKLSQDVTTEPIDEVTAIGTRVPPPPPAPSCDPNYAGQCVPIASDVDCAGGSGNGPAYTRGPVTVVGVDIYDLDRDGDGIGCD